MTTAGTSHLHLAMYARRPTRTANVNHSHHGHRQCAGRHHSRSRVAQRNKPSRFIAAYTAALVIISYLAAPTVGGSVISNDTTSKWRRWMCYSDSESHRPVVDASKFFQGWSWIRTLLLALTVLFGGRWDGRGGAYDQCLVAQ